MTLADISAVTDISNCELGEGFLTFSSLKVLCGKENCFVRVAVDAEKKVLGIAVSIISSQDDFSKFLPAAKYGKLPSLLTSSLKTGVIKTIAVHKQYQRQGIGSAFVTDCLLHFKERNVSTICAFAWKIKAEINMATIFYQQNFTVLKEIENFWFEDSIENNYACPECGAPPCKCSAVVFCKS